MHVVIKFRLNLKCSALDDVPLQPVKLTFLSRGNEIVQVAYHFPIKEIRKVSKREQPTLSKEALSLRRLRLCRNGRESASVYERTLWDEQVPVDQNGGVLVISCVIS